MMNRDNCEIVTGGCLCNAVRYEVNGDVGGILNCHCSKCRRFHGNYASYAGVRSELLNFVDKRGLKWFKSDADETPNVQRGFCRECGSSLFWHPRDSTHIWIALGSMEKKPNLKTLGHVWVSQIGDYYTIDDHLPQFKQGWPEEMAYK